MKEFVHLRIHSMYSIKNSIINIKKILNMAFLDKQKSIALTDKNNIFGSIKFYNLAISKNIKPIIGCDLNIIDKDNNILFQILVLIKNHNGYLQLCKLLNKAWITNNFKDIIIDINWIKKISENNKLDLIALSGGNLGSIGKFILKKKFKYAKESALILKNIFRDNFYIEIQRNNEKSINLEIYHSLEISYNLNIPIVATNPIQFYNKEDFFIHEVRTCIAKKQLINNDLKKYNYNQEQYFKTQKEMISLFSDIPQAIKNTIEISKKCNYSFYSKKINLPVFKTFKKNINEKKILIDYINYGLKNRLKKNKDLNIYLKRIKLELNIITTMGFISYFLIIADIINWSKKNKILTGPGRGSGAGSLIAYMLYITDIDPIKYNLLFERFLNPERISLPDFDIDFCQDGRGKIIKYIRSKYGNEYISQIITFGSSGAKASIKDTGRILGLGYKFCDDISKLIPSKQNNYINIKSAIKTQKYLKQKIEQNKEIENLINIAKKIEGTIRMTGVHAGGILISSKSLLNFYPLSTNINNPNIMIQYDKNDLEKIGLIKFDILGLTTLTIINTIIDNIKKYNYKFNIKKISLKEKIVYKMLSNGDTVGIFQLESKGIKDLLKKMKPNKFKDIIALIALYRPGPINLISEFCDRKNGIKFEYPDNRIKNILNETYGIMIYQEQIMQIAQKIAGYSLSSADSLRRAIGKKDIEEMNKNENIFINGAIKYGLNKKKSKEIFDLIKKFANYGFNKSHATSYALISYYTSYLKCFFPLEFFLSNLNSCINNNERIKIFFNDMKKITFIKILPPDINLSEYNFINIDNVNIRCGLGCIKNIGKHTIQELIKIRRFKKYKNIFDLININKKLINKRVLNNLISSGCLDCFKKNRGILYNIVNSKKKIKKLLLQDSFEFENNEMFLWGPKKYLKEEKISFGFFFSYHLFDLYINEINQINKLNNKKINFNNILELKENDYNIIIGILINIKIKEGEKIYFILTIEDNKSEITIIIDEYIFKKFKNILIIDTLIIFNIVIKINYFSNKKYIKVINIFNFEEVRKNITNYIYIKIKKNKINNLINIIKSNIDNKRKYIPIVINYNNIKKKLKYNINLNDNFIEEIRKNFGFKSIYIILCKRKIINFLKRNLIINK